MPVEADKVLNGAIGHLETCLVLGDMINGALYFAGTSADKGEILFLIERFKHKLMCGDFD